MGHKSKTPKGEISISNYKGRIRLRWRYGGDRFSLNLPFAYLPENMHHATIKVAEIKLDIAKGCFKPENYFPSPSPPQRGIKQSSEAIKKPAPRTVDNLIEYFNNWGKNIRNVDVDNSKDYFHLRRALEKWVNIPIEQLPQKLNAGNWAVSTYNGRLTLLKYFFNWLMDTGVVDKHPLKDISRRRNKAKKKNPRRMPLNEKEINDLLHAIRNDTYCPVASQFKHSYYYPFFVFLFSTGVRNAEAIGLKVKHVDLLNMTVEISETFARTIKGTNHAARIQKGTKTENSRWLPLTVELINLLSSQLSGKEPDDFVFPSPYGLSIDDRMLKRRVLKPVLLKLGFGDRDLYAARHSFGTLAARQGMSLPEIAYLMGHSSIETAMRNYISVTQPATSLPTLNIRNDT